MSRAQIKSEFENEAALCSAFIASLPSGWTAYPETSGFDILLVRATDGAQVGVEAKKTLNAKVLLQAIEGMYSRRGIESEGPDFRAALVPMGTAGAEMKRIARYLGVTIIECREPKNFETEIERRAASYGQWHPNGVDERQAALHRQWAERDVKADWHPFEPELPDHSGYDWRGDWADHCPAKRCKLPDYVPDVTAGASGPSQLSEWKIKAIKICVILEKRGWVSVADFRHVGIDRKRWLDMGWLVGREGFRGHYIAGMHSLDLRRAHPINYGQIEADYEKWKPVDEVAANQGALFNA